MRINNKVPDLVEWESSLEKVIFELSMEGCPYNVLHKPEVKGTP